MRRRKRVWINVAIVAQLVIRSLAFALDETSL